MALSHYSPGRTEKKKTSDFWTKEPILEPSNHKWGLLLQNNHNLCNMLGDLLQFVTGVFSYKLLI